MPPSRAPSTSTPLTSSSSASLLAPGVAAKLALASAALVALPALAWTAARAGKLDGKRINCWSVQSSKANNASSLLTSPSLSQKKKSKKKLCSPRRPATRQRHPAGRLQAPRARRRVRGGRGQPRDASLRLVCVCRGGERKRKRRRWKRKWRGEEKEQVKNSFPVSLSSASLLLSSFFVLVAN
jgi:hypothetical protein